MSDQTVDTTQTEPQDLSIKRARIIGPEGDEEETGKASDLQMEPIVDTPIETDCDSTTDNQSPEKTQMSQSVINYMTDLYERKTFWDQVLDQSKSTQNFDSLKQSLTFKELNVEELVKTKDKRNVSDDCDNKFKHLVTKLKAINELYEEFIDKTKSQINSYQMKDFLKE